MAPPTRVDASRIDAALVAALIRDQFPEWAHLSLRPVRNGGNDHRMFRLGGELVVRLPSAPGYVPQVAKEQEWLPRLGPALPLPIPALCGIGAATDGFPAPWSVYGWIDGRPLSVGRVEDERGIAIALAGFLRALRAADADGAPAPGPHSAFRGGPLQHYDDEMQALLDRVHGAERDRAAGLWRDALGAPFTGRPVWFHGDVAAGNLLVRDGKLAAVIDFGCAGAGDPSCDTVMVWTRFQGRARAAFMADLAVDEATWARGRGWAVWKALIMLTNEQRAQRALARHVLDELAAGH